MFQRGGKRHASAIGSDRQNVDLRDLIRYVDEARLVLEKEGEADAAHYFEMFHTFLTEDVVAGRPLAFTPYSLGL